MSGFLQNPGGGGGGGTVTGTGSANFIAYWTGVSSIGGNTDFQFNPVSKHFQVASGGNRTLVIDPANNTYGLGDLDGLGQGGRLIISDAVGSRALSLITGGDVIRVDLDGVNVRAMIGDTTIQANGTRAIWHDTNLRTDFYSQDYYLRGYNADIVLFAEITPTYADITIGDASAANDGTRFLVKSSDGTITGLCTGFFQIQDAVTTAPAFAVDPTNIVIAAGDTLLAHNGFRFAIFDQLLTMDFASPDGVARFGDPDSLGNDTIFTLDDANMRFRFSTNGTFDITNVGASATWLSINPTAGTGVMGDVDNVFNSTQFSWNDGTSTFQFQGTSMIMGMTRTRINGNLKQPSIVQHNYGVVVDYSADPDFGGRSMAAFTGSTGAGSFLLPTGVVAAIGTIITIKDHDCIGATSNITIDAGVGNTINDTTVAQTTTINTNGGFRVLIKQTSTSWDVIARG